MADIPSEGGLFAAFPMPGQLIIDAHYQFSARQSQSQ